MNIVSMLKYQGGARPCIKVYVHQDVRACAQEKKAKRARQSADAAAAPSGSESPEPAPQRAREAVPAPRLPARHRDGHANGHGGAGDERPHERHGAVGPSGRHESRAGADFDDRRPGDGAGARGGPGEGGRESGRVSSEAPREYGHRRGGDDAHAVPSGGGGSARHDSGRPGHPGYDRDRDMERRRDGAGHGWDSRGQGHRGHGASRKRGLEGRGHSRRERDLPSDRDRRR